MNLYAILPYFCLAILVGSYLATLVVALMSRPKKSKAVPATEGSDPLGGEPGLDFGDELSQMQNT